MSNEIIDKYKYTTIRLHDLLKGQGCPFYNKQLDSKLSLKIETWLLESNSSFQKEYAFLGCKFKKTLRFDFYLPLHNICIEAYGKQHFGPVTFGRTQKDAERDKIKTDYCKSKKIVLIRIPYFETEKVEEILNQIIFKAS